VEVFQIQYVFATMQLTANYKMIQMLY